MPEFVIVSVDDWAGLYKDGELFCEGHSISNYDLLNAGAISEERWLDGTDFERALEEELGGMPQKLEDVPKK